VRTVALTLIAVVGLPPSSIGAAQPILAGLRRASPPHASASTQRVVIYEAGYKPARFFPDNRTAASGFSWRVWTTKEAVGSGTTKTCSPGQVACSTVRQIMTYTRPQELCGRLTFTRFRYSKWSNRIGRLEQISPSFCHWYLFVTH